MTVPRRTPLALPLAVFALALAAPAQQGTGSSYAQAQRPQPDPIGDERIARDLPGLQQQLGAILAEEGVPGGAVVLAPPKGDAVIAVLGAIAPQGKAVDPDTTFLASALSPLLVGLTAARLSVSEADAAAMDPHAHGAGAAAHAAHAAAPADPSGLPEELLHVPLHASELGIDNPFEASAPLRLEQLLEQTAGLWDLSPRERLPAPEMNPPLAQVLGPRARELRWPPGTRSSPSAASITAAAAQLEKWGRGPFAALAEAEVMRPLGLSCTSFRPSGELGARLAPGLRDGRPLEPQAQLHWPARGLVTCPKDLSALLLALLGRFEGGELHGRPLLPPTLAKRLWSGGEEAPGGVPSNGLGTRGVVAEGRRAAGLGGLDQGQAAELAWFPAEGVGYAVLLAAESPSALARAAHVTRRYLLQGLRAPEPPAVAPEQARADLEKAAGVWRPAPPVELRRLLDELLGFAHATVENGALHWSVSLGEPRTLLPAGAGAFRDPASAAPAFALVSRPGGDELVTPSGSFTRAFGPWIYLRLALVGAALLALLLSVLFALLWLPRALFGSLRGAPDLRMRALPALAAVVLAEWLFLWSESTQPLGTLNLTTVLLAILGPVYAALALAALLEALRPPRSTAAPGPAITLHIEGAERPRPPARAPARSARAVRAFCLATSLLATWLAALFALYGLLGLRTWAL